MDSFDRATLALGFGVASLGVSIWSLLNSSGPPTPREVITKGGSAFYSASQVYNNIVFSSGQVAVTGRDESGKPILASGGIVPQSKQSIENLKAVLESSGSDLSNVLKTTVYLADMSYYADFNSVYLKYWPDAATRPARVCFAVDALPFGALVEIECTAMCSDPQRISKL
eukprot:m.265844 g.265844  ORF g.265844 m.265844 type:complete len:170 (-) comp64049_c0_seq1:23-532(-)